MIRRFLHIEDFPLFILYLGFLSTAAAGCWIWLQNRILLSIRPLACASVFRAGLEELLFAAALHLLLAGAVELFQRSRSD